MLSLLSTASAIHSIVKIDSDKVLNISRDSGATWNRTFPIYIYSLTYRANDTVNGELDEPRNASLAKGNNFTFGAPNMIAGDSGSNYPYWHYAIPDFEINKLEMFNGLADHADREYIADARENYSTFFGYYQYDEPELHPTTAPSVEEMLAIYDKAHTVDPNHPVITNSCCINIKTYLGTSDILSWDMYTFFDDADGLVRRRSTTCS